MRERHERPDHRKPTNRCQGTRRLVARSVALVLSVLPLAGCTIGPRLPDRNAARANAPLFPPSERAAKQEPWTTETLAQFEGPGADEIYRIGRGDVLSVDVWGRPELSAKHTVGPDGRVTVPLLGSTRLADLTTDEARTHLTTEWSRYYRGLGVTVRIDQYVANQVEVIGRVSKPGAVQFESAPTLLDVLARVGVLPVGGVGAEKAALTRCAIFRGRDRVAWIDLKALLTGRDLALNIRLRRNDIVYVPDADDQLIYVMGQVGKPGAYRLTPDMSFLDALAQAGGPTVDSAADRLILVRPALGLQTEIDLGDLLAGNARPNTPLEEGDIVYVPQNNLAKIGYVFQKLSPVTGFFLFANTINAP